jgi:hypothetical protein
MLGRERVFSLTETCVVLSLVNGSRFRPLALPSHTRPSW